MNCPKTHFKTDFEKKFWEAHANDKNELFMYCVANNEAYSLGTRESKVLKKDHAYLVYEFKKCQAANQLNGEAPCADISAINDWLTTKVVHMRILNEKLD